jgi:hypothetical protein
LSRGFGGGIVAAFLVVGDRYATVAEFGLTTASTIGDLITAISGGRAAFSFGVRNIVLEACLTND